MQTPPSSQWQLTFIFQCVWFEPVCSHLCRHHFFSSFPTLLLPVLLSILLSVTYVLLSSPSLLPFSFFPHSSPSFLSLSLPFFPSFFPLLFSPLLPLRVRVHSILTSSQLVSVMFVLSVVGCACFDLCVVPAASGWVPDGAAVPIPGLADVSRHAHLQTFFPETGSSGGQMAGRVRRRRGTHCSTLPVRVLLSTIDTAVC